MKVRLASIAAAAVIVPLLAGCGNSALQVNVPKVQNQIRTQYLQTLGKGFTVSVSCPQVQQPFKVGSKFFCYVKSRTKGEFKLGANDTLNVTEESMSGGGEVTWTRISRTAE